MRLVELAYTRVEMVTARGEFAVRGGLVDIFPPTVDQPVRVEFWGDEVSELRTFGVSDQRSIAAVDVLVAPGCRELLLTEPVRERAAALARQHENNAPLRELLEHLAEGIPAEGMESLVPALVGGELELLTDLLPVGSLVLLADPERIRTRSADLVRTGQEFLEASWFAAGTGGDAPIDVGASAYRGLARGAGARHRHRPPRRHAVARCCPGAEACSPRRARGGELPRRHRPRARRPARARRHRRGRGAGAWAVQAPRSGSWSSCGRPTCPPCASTSWSTSPTRAWSR